MLRRIAGSWNRRPASRRTRSGRVPGGRRVPRASRWLLPCGLLILIGATGCHTNVTQLAVQTGIGSAFAVVDTVITESINLLVNLLNPVTG